MSYTLGEAAKAVGRTKPTILRAIKSHKISATKDEASGNWVIDPAELHRVYPPVSNEHHDAQRETALSDNTLQVEVTLLRERLADKDAMIAELRDDRDQWREQAQRLAITDQRERTIITPPPPETPAAQTPVLPQTRGWWRFGKR